MWELYAFWAWIGAATAVSFAGRLGDGSAGCGAAPHLRGDRARRAAVPAGGEARRPRSARRGWRRARWWSAPLAGLATAAAFGGPVWLFVPLVLVWGAAVIPDSAQFSALVADAAPPERAGSLLTFQTAIGFTLTFFTVQAVPAVAAALGLADDPGPDGGRTAAGRRGDAQARPDWGEYEPDLTLDCANSADGDSLRIGTLNAIRCCTTCGRCSASARFCGRTPSRNGLSGRQKCPRTCDDNLCVDCEFGKCLRFNQC